MVFTVLTLIPYSVHYLHSYTLQITLANPTPVMPPIPPPPPASVAAAPVSEAETVSAAPEPESTTPSELAVEALTSSPAVEAAGSLNSYFGAPQAESDSFLQ